MEVKLLKGGTAKINLWGRLLKNRSDSKSAFQYQVGQELQRQYPHDMIFEEVPIHRERLVLDFFIPSLRLVVECHGRQHAEHVIFFHPTKRDFHQQQDRDDRKRLWCELNGFKLIEVHHGKQHAE